MEGTGALSLSRICTFILSLLLESSMNSACILSGLVSSVLASEFGAREKVHCRLQTGNFPWMRGLHQQQLHRCTLAAFPADLPTTAQPYCQFDPLPCLPGWNLLLLSISPFCTVRQAFLVQAAALTLLSREIRFESIKIRWAKILEFSCKVVCGKDC